jgi:hypothetical protein
VKDFSKIASPLIMATMQKGKRERSPACTEAFETLGTTLVDKVLILPDWDKPFRIDFDASLVGIGGVLSQQQEGEWRPVAFFSRHLSARERNYSATERELMAGVETIEHFKAFVYGRPFLAVTDHQPLKAMIETDFPKNKSARWLNRLNNYEFTIEYRKGTTHGNADVVGRLPRTKEGFE